MKLNSLVIPAKAGIQWRGRDNSNDAGFPLAR